MRVIAITGGSGVVGRALIRQLAIDLPTHRLLLLTRRPDRLHFPNATVAFADIREPGLGLNAETRRVLREDTELFVHAAADTCFHSPLDQSRRTNTEGARNALAVARECRRLRHFAHISSLYIAGRRQGRVLEEPLRHSDGYVNSYEESKHEAEELLFAEFRNLPIGVYRLSSVVDLGGSGGHVRKALRLARWAGRFRFFPGEARVPVDIVSSEWAAQALAVLLKECPESSRIRHVCAGEGGAVPFGGILEMVLGAYESVKGQARPRVELVPLREFEQSSGAHARAFDSLMTFIPHLSLMQPFDNQVTSSLLRRYGVEPAESSSIVAAVVEQEWSAHTCIPTMT